MVFESSKVVVTRYHKLGGSQKEEFVFQLLREKSGVLDHTTLEPEGGRLLQGHPGPGGS